MAGIFPPTSPTMVEKLLDPTHPRWVAFDKAYRQGIEDVCRNSGLDRTDAEDLAQEVLLKVARSINTYDRGKGRFRTWLNRVIDSCFIDFCRSPRWRKLPQQDDAFFDRLVGDLSAHLGGNLELKAQTAIATMQREVAARDAEVFERRYHGRESPEQVAREMPPMTVENVNQVFSRCNAKLREVIAAMDLPAPTGVGE